MTLAVLITLALALPGPNRDLPETAPQRRARVEMIAGCAWDASLSQDAAPWPWDRSDLAVAALVVTWFESGRWSLRVHRAAWTRDVGGRATCLGSLHVSPWVPVREWRTLHGTRRAATERCLRAVVRVLARHAARCSPGLEETQWQIGRVFSAYGTGRCSRAPASWARRRAWVWGRWRER